MFRIILIYVIFTLLISGLSCANIEQIFVPEGEPFSFDCRKGESVYFGQELNDWIEIRDNDYESSNLQLNFKNINHENRLRVTSNAAISQNFGYYACRIPTAREQHMRRIYKLVKVDVDLFYWSYVCHAPIGSCVRFDDPADETQSTFEVADQTKVDLFCCASVSGYENVNIKMNQIGESQNEINVKRKQELDGSWVICANQHTMLKKTYSRYPETLTCELIINDKVYSSFNSLITMKNSMPIIPDTDSSGDFNPSSEVHSNTQEYFNRQKPTSGVERRKSTIGKTIAIIVGSLIGSILLIALLFSLVFLFICKNKTSKNSSKKSKSQQQSPLDDISIKDSRQKEQNPKEKEPLYVEPIPEYENASIFLRL